ncbi:tripartite tricarboxylate transporter substrate-binding protein [Variovorax soli]|uniref:Tripartite-type tricarboxylate transporter receptor subunit TctC n=1 Tax=Variovorax soli TaxID=376815 RepID=A0ABU1NM05_9BURK|nr:tripartite tricarboxylate transporter substrate-binding protein [Variovorax soli]MDR6539383.1 tripartite-type tricarboxylate transporter receptor subunit TctC [Variovorax soli]
MTEITRRRFAKYVACLAPAPALFTATARAQGDGTMGRIVVGYPAGGTLDQTARRLAESWRTQNRPFLVDNRPGAAGRIASAQMKRERADGSVVLCTHTSAMTIYPHVYTRLAYDPDKDLRPVANLASATCVLAISTAVPPEVRTLADYARWLKSNEAARTYASPAAGSLAQFLGYRFSQAAGVGLTHVAYRGSAPAMQDLLGGQVPAYIGFAGDFLQYLGSGKLRLLAVSSDRRSRFLPNVPSFAEQGFGSVTGLESYGVFVPAATPDSTVAALAAATQAAARDKTLIAGLEQIGLEPAYAGSGDYARLIATEREHWKPIVAASGFKADE